MTNTTSIMLLLKRVDCIDGVAAYVETLAAGLAAQGERVLVVSGPVTTPDGSVRRADAIRAAAVEWLVIPDLDTNRPRPAQLRAILAAARRHGVGVVSPQGLALLPYAALLSRLLRVPSVANYHPSLTGTSAAAMATARPLTQRLFYRAVATLFPASRFIAISRDIVAFYRDDCGIAPRRIHYQVLGVDTGLYRAPSDAERDAARAALGIAPGTLVAVLPGRLNLVKGHDVAIAALRRLRATRPDLRIQCLFAGTGSQKEEIEAAAFETEADHASFRFLGYIAAPERLREIYWASDVLLLPSRFEGFPTVVAETMCAGCVPVRTPAGGWRDQIEDGVTGYVVPFNDPDAIAARLEALADPVLRARLRDAATAYAHANFSRVRMLEGTAALYREVRAAGR